MYKQITIKTLHKQGLNQAEIAKQLGCHRHTVARIVERKTIIEQQAREKGSIFDPYQEHIRQMREKRLSVLKIFETLRDDYKVHSTYVNLCKYIQVHFPKQREAFGVQVTEPGEVAEIDFGYLGMFPGPKGSLAKTYGLAVILHYSRLGFYAITYDQKLETLVHELENAFVYFSGVPKKLKVDNMKTAIIKNQHYDLQFNQDFLEFAYHYQTVIQPCTPYSPEQKGTVESGIKYMQGNFIAAETFQSSIEIKQKLRGWMDHANKRVHGTTRKIPKEVFLIEEKNTLQNLPDTPFAFFNRGVRMVGANCHIHFENNYYSVPSHIVGREVTVRWNEAILRIIHEGEQVAMHQRATGIGQYVTRRSHLPDYKIYSETEYQKKAEEQMADIGADAHEYFRFLLEKKESYWFRSVRLILGMVEKYGKEAVNLALKRAQYYQVRDLSTIKNILEKKLYLIAEEPRLLQKQETGEMFRDLSYYTERSTA